MNAHSSSALVSCDVCRQAVPMMETALLGGSRICFACSLKPGAKPRPWDTPVGRAITFVAGTALLLLALWELFFE